MRRYKIRKGHKGLNLAFDRFLSWNFIPIFITTLLATAVLFWTLFFVFKLFGSSISPVQAFIQMTNPTEWEPSLHGSNAVALVALNVFGMFVLNGLLLTFLINWVSNRRSKAENGLARYGNVTRGRFTVIIGGHPTVPSLAHNIFKDSSDKSEFILIQTRRDPERLRKEIFAEIADANLRKHIIIYSGDRTSWHELVDLSLEKALAVYIVGEAPHIDGTSHDALNLKCWELINEHITVELDSAHKIPCHIMFDHRATLSAFQNSDLRAEASAAFSVEPFSFYDVWASKVIADAGTGDSCYIPLDGTGGIRSDSRERAHIIIVGMSKMGMAMAVEAAHVAHYPNFDNPEVGRPRTLITFIDRNAKREMMQFSSRFNEILKLARWRYLAAPGDFAEHHAGEWNIYDSVSAIAGRCNDRYRWNYPLEDESFGSPYYGGYLGEDFIDIDFEFIQGDVELPSVQKYIADACADKLSKTTVAVCLPLSSEAMSAALYFHDSVYENAQEILVMQNQTGAMVDALRGSLAGAGYSKYKSLRPFGMVDGFDYPKPDKNFAAKCVAYAYACLDRREGPDFFTEYTRVGERRFIANIEANWFTFTSEKGKSVTSQRWSNFYCAATFASKMRDIGLPVVSDNELTDADAVECLARVEHTRWLFEQLLTGYRPVDKSYADRYPIGNISDDDKKLRRALKSRGVHPDLVSNARLSATSRYDAGIVRIIPLAMWLTRRLLEQKKDSPL